MPAVLAACAEMRLQAEVATAVKGESVMPSSTTGNAKVSLPCVTAAEREWMTRCRSVHICTERGEWRRRNWLRCCEMEVAT